MTLLQKASMLGLVVVSLACDNLTSASSDRPPAEARAAQQQPVNRMGAAVKAFQDRIKEYDTFHHNVQKMVPALDETADPAKISAREKALGEQLIKSRPNAKQGDFFIKEFQPYLVQIIKEDFAQRSLADRKALIQELPKGVAIDVNIVYPTTLPLATFPGKLLKKLPELPPELEYRIVARHLVLRDVKGNVIVDLMRDVFPIPTK